MAGTNQTRHYEVTVGPNRWARCVAAKHNSDGTLTYTLYDGRKGVAAREQWCTVYSPVRLACTCSGAETGCPHAPWCPCYL